VKQATPLMSHRSLVSVSMQSIEYWFAFGCRDDSTIFPDDYEPTLGKRFNHTAGRTVASTLWYLNGT
jgi:hypothetical protein